MDHRKDFIDAFRELKIPDGRHSRYLQLCDELGIDHPLDFSFWSENELIRDGFLEQHAKIFKKRYETSMRDNVFTAYKNMYKERRRR